jgi:CBS domain-containing protein
MMLDAAARKIVESGGKSLPVVDEDGRVIGVLTETDFLRRLNAGTFLELLLKMVADSCEVSHRCHETPVREAMTAPAVTVRPQAGFRQIIAAFRRHAGRSMPVVDDDGRLAGMLLRKDFLEALDRGAHR